MTRIRNVAIRRRPRGTSLIPTVGGALVAAKGAFDAGYQAGRSIGQRFNIVDAAIKNAKKTVVKSKARPKKVYSPRRSLYGRAGRRFKKPRRARFTRLRARGTQTTVEVGGTMSSPNALYLGHGTPIIRLFNEVCRAITKKMFAKAGHRIVSMGQKVQDYRLTYIVAPGEIVIHYRRNAADAVKNVAVSLAADTTYAEVAVLIASEILSIYNNAGSSDAETMVDSICLYTFDSTGTKNRMPDVQLVLSSMSVQMTVASKLQIQNRTAATTSGTTDESNMLDIANNPLDGKCYGGRGTAPALKFADNTGADLTDAFQCGRETGLIEALPETAANYTPEMMNNLKRPPSAYAFLFTRSHGNVSLAPGQIKKSFMSYKKTMGLTKFFLDMHFQLRMASLVRDHRHDRYGKFLFYGFQKRCNTGVDEPDINVGYELNTTITAAVSEKPVVTIKDFVVY